MPDNHEKESIKSKSWNRGSNKIRKKEDEESAEEFSEVGSSYHDL